MENGITRAINFNRR